MKILIVEDNANDRKLLRLNLERHGCEVISSQNGMEALEALKQQHPDLIVSDALMPHMDGFGLLRAVKKDKDLASIPFVFYSAVYTGDQDRELALAMGAEAFVSKPMEPESFWRLLHKIISKCQVQGSTLPKLSPSGEEDFYRQYSRIVATKLEEKVAMLEAELNRRKQLEREKEEIIRDLTQANQDLGKLTDVVSDSFSTLNLDEMLRLFLARIVKALDAGSATVFLRYGEYLRIRASIGMEKSLAARYSVLLGEGVPGIIATTGEALYIKDAAADKQVINPEIQDSGIVSMFGVPIKHNKDVIGTIQVGWNEMHPEIEREKLLLSVTAERCGNAIVNCTLFERSEKIRKHLAMQIKQMPIAHIVWDQNFSVQSWNPAATRIFGYTAENAIGRHPFDLIVPVSEQAKALELWDSILQDTSETGIRITSGNRSSDGRSIVCEWHHVPLRKTDGSLRGVVSMALDITESAAAEEKLRLSKEEWERTFNAMPEVVTIQDKDFRIIRCNEATCRLLGLPREEILGRVCHERLWGIQEHCPGCPALETFADSMTHQTEIIPLGMNKNFMVSTTKLFDKDGTVEQIIHVAKDISEQKATEEKYRHAQKMEAIGTLASGIAHDFNNILSGILGYAELARMDIVSWGKPTEDVDNIIQAEMRAADLVRQILTFSRQTEKERRPVHLHHIIKEALKLLRPSLPSTIEIRENIAEQCDEVLADISQVHQIVMNLCTNAYQAMGEKGGVLEIGLQQETIGNDDRPEKRGMKPGNYAVFTVKDSGCGMDSKTMERIFEPYFTTKMFTGGTGLGLAVVHGIVTESGGNITVHSEPGKGTTFTVYLPVTEESHENSQPKSDDILPLPTGTETILFVDDEKMLVELNKRLLESLGYRVTNISDSMAALELFRQAPETFDLIIIDLAMPRLDGIELARQIMTILPDALIIMITGYCPQSRTEEAAAIGVHEILKKPFSGKELAKAVRKVLDGDR